MVFSSRLRSSTITKCSVAKGSARSPSWVSSSQMAPFSATPNCPSSIATSKDSKSCGSSGKERVPNSVNWEEREITLEKFAAANQASNSLLVNTSPLLSEMDCVKRSTKFPELLKLGISGSVLGSRDRLRIALRIFSLLFMTCFFDTTVERIPWEHLGDFYSFPKHSRDGKSGYWEGISAHSASSYPKFCRLEDF